MNPKAGLALISVLVVLALALAVREKIPPPPPPPHFRVTLTNGETADHESCRASWEGESVLYCTGAIYAPRTWLKAEVVP